MRTMAHVTLSVALLAVAAIALAPQAAMAQDEPMQMMIRITDTDIVSNVTAPEGGLYLVTVRNESSGNRGVVMKGIDRGVSPYTRFTRILAPGQEMTFRWYFPDNRTVALRDMINCVQVARSCGLASTFGDLTESIAFG